MDQFTDKDQINNYDLARPKYTNDIFSEIIKNTCNFNDYLDVACGTGQVNNLS